MNQHQWRLSNRLASDCNGKGNTDYQLMQPKSSVQKISLKPAKFQRDTTIWDYLNLHHDFLL